VRCVTAVTFTVLCLPCHLIKAAARWGVPLVGSIFKLTNLQSVSKSLRRQTEMISTHACMYPFTNEAQADLLVLVFLATVLQDDTVAIVSVLRVALAIVPVLDPVKHVCGQLLCLSQLAFRRNILSSRALFAFWLWSGRRCRWVLQTCKQRNRQTTRKNLPHTKHLLLRTLCEQYGPHQLLV
jgi:hypothetical protein